MANIDPLTLRITYSAGSGSLKTSVDHPLFAPIRVALASGKPPGQWHWVGLDDEAAAITKLVGSFVHSPGNRLLFFPGATMDVIADDESNQPTRLDHVTLDKPSRGRHRSHLALSSTLGENRSLDYTIRPPDGYLVPWFSLLVPDLSMFATLARNTEVTVSPPRPHVKGFADDLLKGLNISTAPLSTGNKDNRFFQMDAWVGRTPGWKRSASSALSWVYRPELVSGAPPDSQNVNVTQLELSFTESVGVRLLCCWPSGRLSNAHILRPKFQPNTPASKA